MKHMYIPNEIKIFIWEYRDKKINLWRTAYNYFKDLYSLFSITDYVRIVRYLSNNKDINEEINVNKDCLEYFDLLECKWIEILEKEFGKYISEEDGYSKIIFFLTLLEGIHNKTIIKNRFYLPMSEIYNFYWRKNKPKSIKTCSNFYKIIITLQDSPFYQIKLVDDAGPNLPCPNKRIWEKNIALNYIDYSFIDDELFDLMYRDSFAKKLQQVISIYINSFDHIF